MNTISVIQAIAQVFTLCGIVSIRMFLPVFTYFSLLRLAVEYPSYAPKTLADMAVRVPEWQISLPFLIIVGSLAILELAAIRNPEIKEFLTEEVDKFAKPVLSILLAFSVINTSQSDEIRQLFEGSTQIQQAGVGSMGYLLALLGGGVTAVFCHFRAVILEKLHSIDPDNSIGLQTISNFTGEFLLIVILLLLVFLPVAALVLILCQFAIIAVGKKWLARYESKYFHLCPSCGELERKTKVSNSALACPVCGKEQTDVQRVGPWGLPSGVPLNDYSRTQHSINLLAARRCRCCALPLKSGETNCSVCGRKQWEDEKLVNDYLRRTDIRAGILLGISLLSFLLPLIGCTVVMIFFRPFVLRPLTVHLGIRERLGVAFLSIYFKLLAAILLIILATIPGIGLLYILPFGVRYMAVRKKFKRTISI